MATAEPSNHRTPGGSGPVVTFAGIASFAWAYREALDERNYGQEQTASPVTSVIPHKMSATK